MNEQSTIHALYRTPAIWNVPTTFTPLVGREKEIASLITLLRCPDIRLLTLLGTGGTGKTRLSIQLAREIQPFFLDGVCFVSLSSLNLAERVVPAIAEALHIQRISAMSAFEQVTNSLCNRHMLLILDNFEQIIAVAPLLEDLLSLCPLLKILVTSREVLHLQAEHEFPVLPLALPPYCQVQSDKITEYAAVALFVQRAQAVLPSFEVTEANAHVIAELCTCLDGLPLAIELAAARVKLFPPEALLKRLAQRFQILTSGGRTLPERHRTLFNTIKWSYNLLNTQEQWLFRRLSVFVGDWTLQAAEAVCAENETITLLDGITSLLDKSLLLQVEHEKEEPRLRMLMTVREYGLECLHEYGELESVQLAHALYYLAFVEEAELYLKGSEQITWLTRLEQEQQNLRIALERLIRLKKSELALRLCGALWYFWFLHSYWSEGRNWLKKALALPPENVDIAIRARALSAAGEFACQQGDNVEARPLLEESVALYRSLKDEDGLIRVLSNLERVLQEQGDSTGGNILKEKAIALSRKLNKRYELAHVLPGHEQNDWIQTLPEHLLSVMQHPAKPIYPDNLTSREVEVLRLLAKGWSDAQIADHLVISKHTVNKHTASIYSKIGVTSRSAATRYAILGELT